MKTIQIKLKIVLMLLLVGFTFTNCSKEDNPEPPVGNNEAITLDCQYFLDNPNAILKDDPEAPAVDYIITRVFNN